MIALAYLVSFVFIRIAVIVAGSAGSEIANLVKEGANGPSFHIGRNIILFGYHIHHFYFGVVLIVISGWLAIVGRPKVRKETLALIFGAGLGLFMDEVGLLLTWGDYASRLSYLLGVLLLAIILNLIYFPRFWRKIRETVERPGAHTGKINRAVRRLMKLVDTITGNRPDDS